MEGYLKDQQGNYIPGPGGHPISREWFHDCDEFGRLRPGASLYCPGGPSPTVRPRATYSPPLTRTQAPVTRSYRQSLQPLRRIGNPGVWTDLTAWWKGLKTEHKWGIGGVGGLAVIGIVVAAARGGKGEAGLKKI